MSGRAPAGDSGVDVELLADLDAGVLDSTLARAVRAAAEADPAARSVLAALAATRAQLAVEPELTVPPEVATRWAAALAAEGAASGSGPGRREPSSGGREPSCSSPSFLRDPRARPTGPGRRSRRTEPQAMRSRTPLGRFHQATRRLASGVALIAVLIGPGVLLARPDAPSDPGVVSFARVDLATVGTATVGVVDLGELADPTRRTACLAAVGITADAAVLGGRRVVMDGRRGVLLVLGTGRLGRLRLVVVDNACGRGSDTLLAETTIGR